MTSEVIPDLSQLPSNIEYQLTEHGGHVGFVGGTLLKPEMWLEQRIPNWLSPFLDQASDSFSSGAVFTQKPFESGNIA